MKEIQRVSREYECQVVGGCEEYGNARVNGLQMNMQNSNGYEKSVLKSMDSSVQYGGHLGPFLWALGEDFCGQRSSSSLPSFGGGACSYLVDKI